MTIRKLFYTAIMVSTVLLGSKIYAQPSLPGSATDLPNCDTAIAGGVIGPDHYGRLLACRCYVALMNSNSDTYTIDLSIPGQPRNVMPPFFTMNNIQGAYAVNQTDDKGVTTTIGIATFIQNNPLPPNGHGQMAVCNFFFPPNGDTQLSQDAADSYINSPKTNENNYITCSSAYSAASGQLVMNNASNADPNCSNPFPPASVTPNAIQ